MLPDDSLIVKLPCDYWFIRTVLDGVYMESLPPIKICGIYVFVRDDDIWKLAGFFNTADPRDWDYAPDWLKDIIGELPDQDLCEW